VRMIVDARPIKEIASELGITRNTIGRYLSLLYAKLGVHSRAELTLWAMYEEIEARRKLEEPAA